MNTPNSNLNDLETDISDLIQKELEGSSVLLGITIGSSDGNVISSLYKKDFKLNKLTKLKISSANSSVLFISSKMLEGTLNQKISHSLIAGKDKYLVSILFKNITMIAYLNRELAELEGLNKWITHLKSFSEKCSAIVETSQIIKEEIFVSIKRAIPNILVLAIITKEGLPIKIQSSMPEPMISAMISAIYNLYDVLLEENLEYSIVSGENGSIIIHKLDENRILCIAVPEADESKLGAYIVKIKAIIK